ncbi:hypothetical protein E4656_12385 [Natronospirillum operosum]|uniref:Uncharacterized protein n=1 Tax=Natronospirillum operosum TaxID=2759953 RepID=A0A4Z0W9U6_9GAMM|nr:DUF6463 family protein [Natronospirillum operosum]TGG92913.1 hypothetical protein E4656_12385 [Natronospirillum operosum]
MRLYLISGWLLVAIGVLHNSIGLVMGWPILTAIVAEGGWNTIEAGGQMHFDRSAILWFLLTGCFWMLLGYLMQSWIRVVQAPLPKVIGWGLLAAGVVVAFLLPASGAWLFIPLGLLVLLGAPKQTGFASPA